MCQPMASGLLFITKSRPVAAADLVVNRVIIIDFCKIQQTLSAVFVSIGASPMCCSYFFLTISDSNYLILTLTPLLQTDDEGDGIKED